MARLWDFRARAAERERQQFERFYSRSVDRIYAENRNAIATFRDQAIAEAQAYSAGPHSWAVAESAHNTEMRWRDKQSWVDIGGRDKSSILTDEQRKAAVGRSRMHYLNDPLYIRAIDLTAVFIYGAGVTTPKPAWGVVDTDKDAVTALVNGFWHDDFNLRVLTGNLAQLEVCRTLLIDGAVPFVLDLATNRVSVADVGDIAEVKEHSQMRGVPMLYRRQEGVGQFRWYWSIEAEVYKSDAGFAAERDRLEAEVGTAYPIDEGSVMFCWHYGTGFLGQPPFYSALDWGAANTLLAGNLQSYVKAVTAIVGKVKGKFTATDISNLQTQLKSNLSQTKGLPPPTGSMRVEGEGQDWQFLNVPSGGQTIFHEGFEVSRLMVSAATGIPIHWLGDPSTGNLATATAMELAQLKTFEGWQQWWIGQYDSLFRSLARLSGITTDTARFIEIDFPALTQDDFMAKATGLATIKAAGGMSDADFARQVAYLCQADDVEAWVQRVEAGTEGIETELTAMAEHAPMRFVAMYRRVATKLAEKVKG